MPHRRRPRRPAGSRRALLVPAVALALGSGLLAGCSQAGAAARVPGDHVTRAEAQELADLLHQDRVRGGADFTETAPYAEGALLTLTGTVDFVSGRGRATAVTTYSNGQPTDTRTIWFTDSTLWMGQVPELAQTLTAARLPAAAYVRRPLATNDSNQDTPALIDVAAQLVVRLSAQQADDPRPFESGDYTWQGQRSINGRLAAQYRLASGAQVAVAASDKMLLQYVTPLPGQGFAVTTTLTAHGPRTVDLPPDGQTVDLTAHPQVAAALGM
jgi:hypothetical protein